MTRPSISQSRLDHGAYSRFQFLANVSVKYIQLVRIRSRDGNFRFELQPTSDISELVAKVW